MFFPRLFTSLLLLTVVLAARVNAETVVEQGLALAQAVYDAPHGEDFAAAATMILSEKGREPRVREMLVLRADPRPAERWSLPRFSEPADVRGVSILTQDYPGEQSDQWLYLPALKRVRRISSGRKGGRFVGSDVFVEDVREREVDMDRHVYQGESKLGKITCKVLVSTPVDPDNSVYSKRVSWIHPETLIPLRVDLYQGESKDPAKRLSVKRIKRIQGYWTVVDSVMADLGSGHQTRIRYSAVKYNQKIPESLFSSRAMADERAALEFKP